MTTTDTPLLAVRGLTKTITLHILGGATVTPFHDISFAVADGAFVALAGPSGSGKSSIIKALHRTYLTTAGAARYRAADGTTVDLARAPDRTIVALRRRELGFVSQFLRVEPRVPALDIVAAPLLRQGVAPAVARERAAALLDRLAVPERLWGSYPSLFSGGEQQRVNIARALISRPRLLLADEPTSALDEANVDRVVDALLDARAAGTTIVGVFHDVGLIERLADHIVLLRDGQITQQGRVGEVVIPRFATRQEVGARV